MHKPVLLQEVLHYLDPKPNENFIDCTVGEAGHTRAILERNGPTGKILGIDRDPEMVNRASLLVQDEFRPRTIFVSGNFADLKKIAEEEKFGLVHGILFDLGLSTWHLEKSGRGFSFQKDEPLVMKYNRHENGFTAGDILNNWPPGEIEKIFREYGEERFVRKIVEKIAESRKIKPIKTSIQLADIIKKAIPARFRGQKIHPATRVFQALRIVVNKELQQIERALPQAADLLEPGGRMVVISFHSLEDRIVKNFFQNESRQNLEILTKKPVIAGKEELRQNPRSRSAKLRAAIKKF